MRWRLFGRAGNYEEAADAAEQWQRTAMNTAIGRRIESLGPAGLTAAEISGDAQKDRGWMRFESLDYPDFDLCGTVEGRGQFDVVICEQVIEHVVDPFLAARNLFALCKAGGHTIVSTPFLIKVHELPAFGLKDYWRFTPRGLRLLLENAGFEVEEVGNWGNRECVVANLDVWAAYRPGLPLEAEPDIPVQVWAFARRPGTGT